MRLAFGGLIAVALLALAGAADAQPGKKAPAKKKPEKKDTKHPRLKQEKPAGQRVKLSMGTLFLPDALPKGGDVPVLFHFHGAGWIAEVAARNCKLPVVHVALGEGSAKYEAPFKDKARFGKLLAEAEKKAGRKFERVALSGWSAGYGAVRMILRQPDYYKKVRWAILIDGMHTSYLKGKKVNPDHMGSFLTFAKDAAAGNKQFLITHTKIAPGSYSSTTETADYLLAQVGVKRAKHTGPGLFGLPQETEARKGGLRVFGCAGAKGEDHVDHLHALPSLVALLELSRK
jgi:hypothetical protein